MTHRASFARSGGPMLNLLSAIADAATFVAPRVREAVGLSADDNALARSLSQAAWRVAQTALRGEGDDAPTDDQVEFLARSFLEPLGSLTKASWVLQNGDRLRTNLINAIATALAPLDEPASDTSSASFLAELEVEWTVPQIATGLVDELCDNMLLWSGASAHQMRDFALQLQIDRMQEPDAATPLSSEGEQARQVAAWITVESDPPQVEVHNRSDAPIFDVIPTPALIAHGPAGEPGPMVGFGPLSPVAQISPGSTCIWPLQHMVEWGGDPLVFSQLHLEFTDAAGRRWLHAHDHVVRIGDR